MRYDPEGILLRSGLEPLTITSFLHENYLDFIDEGAMDDVADAAGYLSDAGGGRLAAGMMLRSGPRSVHVLCCAVLMVQRAFAHEVSVC